MRIPVTIAVVCISIFCHAQRDVKPLPFFQPDTSLNKLRLLGVVSTEAALSTGSLIALGQAWYSDYPRTTFHTFDDNKEWLQMDKAGHVVTAYTVGRYGLRLLEWAGVPHKKATWFGGLTGFAYQGAIEMLDGYSSGWGFSWSDVGANAIGSGMLIGQELLWKEQRITLKYGFRKSGYAQYRPELLGSSFSEQLLKDYNGQTYWLSVNVASFLDEQTRFPQWLNLAFGYGANGMTGGHENPPLYNSSGNAITFERYRQYYLSFDVDLTKIPTRSPFLETVFETFGFLKIPAPGLELSRGRLYGRALAF